MFYHTKYRHPSFTEQCEMYFFSQFNIQDNKTNIQKCYDVFVYLCLTSKPAWLTFEYLMGTVREKRSRKLQHQQSLSLCTSYLLWILWLNMQALLCAYNNFGVYKLVPEKPPPFVATNNLQPHFYWNLATLLINLNVFPKRHCYHPWRMSHFPLGLESVLYPFALSLLSY